MKLLVVDDDPVAAEMLGDVLRAHRHEVSVAGDWIGLMEAIQVEHFEAVFLDVGLPGIQGTKLVEQIIAMSDGTRVILFSGLPQEELRVLAEETGSDGYLAKSQGVDLAPRILQRVLLSVERRRALGAAEEGASRESLAGLSAVDSEVQDGPLSSAPPAPEEEQPPSVPTSAPYPSVPGTATASPPTSLPPWSPEAQSSNPWLPDVVLVDGDSRRRKQLVSWFLDRGFGIHALDNGDAGLGVLEATRPPPEIFMLAASAPGPGVEETVRRLRGDPALKSVVVILIEDRAEEGESSTSQGDGNGVDQVLRGVEGIEKLPKILSNRVRMLQWLRRLRQARDDLL